MGRRFLVLRSHVPATRARCSSAVIRLKLQNFSISMYPSACFFCGRRCRSLSDRGIILLIFVGILGSESVACSFLWVP